MATSNLSCEKLLAQCLSQSSAAGQSSWTKEGRLLIMGEVHRAASLLDSSLLTATLDLIGVVGQLARSSAAVGKDGPPEALERAARGLTEPLNKCAVGLTQHTQGLLEETVTALVQVVGLLKTPLNDQASVQSATSLVSLLETLRRQLLAEPAFRMPGSLVARSRAFLLGMAEQRSAKHNLLPSPTPAFRGRDALLTQMQNGLTGTPASGRRSLLVRGRRGMGKTQLVLAYVLRNLAQYDKVLWLAAGTPAWRVHYLQLGAYVGVDLIAQSSWEERAAQVRAGIGAFEGRLLLVIDGADEKVNIRALVPQQEERGTLHLIVATSTPLLQLENADELDVPELSDAHAMALLRGSNDTGSAASEANLASAAASFKDLTLTLAVAACLFREGAAVPSVLLDHADPLGLQNSRRRNEGAGQFWLGRCCYEALRFLEDSGKEKALLASTSALVGGWFGPGGISLELLVGGLQWHIGSRVNATKVEAALVELGRLGIATRQEDGSVVFPSVLRNYVAADKKRGGHHAMLRALASTTCDWGNNDHFRAVWLRRAELSDSYPRKQLVLLIGLKTVQFFLAGSGEYEAAESMCTQALAWLGKDEPTWRAEFVKHQAQALAAQRKYAAAAQIWQAQTQAGEAVDAEDAFMPRNFRSGLSPLPLDLSQSRESSINGDATPNKSDTPDGSLDRFHASLPNIRITPLPEANGKAQDSEAADSTPKSNLSIVSAFTNPRKRLSRVGSLAMAERSFSRPVSPSTFADTLRRSTSTPHQRATPPKTPRSMSPHLTRMNTLKNGSPEATAEVLRQENDTLVRASPLPARPVSAYQNRRKSWSPSLRTSRENEEREVVAARAPEALLGQAAATACEGDLEGALRLLHQAREHPAAEEGAHVAEVLGRQGLVQLAVGESAAGMESLKEAAGAALEKGDVTRCQHVVAYADALAEAGRAKEALESYRSVGDLLAKELGASSPFLLDVRQRQAVAEVGIGAAAEGVALLEEVRTAHQTTLLPTSPVRAAALQALADAYAAQGRNEEALVCWEEAATIQLAALPSRSPALARSLLVGAGLYQAKQRKKEAAENVKKALAIEESVQPTGSQHLARSLAQAANVLRAQKRYDEALPLAQRSVELYQKASGGNPLEVAASLEALASVQTGRKRFDEAQPLFTKALAIHEQTDTANKETAELLTNMAEAAELQGRKEKAQPLVERAIDIYDKLGVAEDDPGFVRARRKVAGLKWQRQVSGFCCAPKTR